LPLFTTFRMTHQSLTTSVLFSVIPLVNELELQVDRYEFITYLLRDDT